MKQRITLEQLNELSDKAKKKLKEWWKPQFGDVYYYGDAEDYFAKESALFVFGDLAVGPHTLEKKGLPLLSVGQMVKYLYGVRNVMDEYEWSGYIGKHIEFVCEATDLCDYLWSIVKEVLEK